MYHGPRTVPKTLMEAEAVPETVFITRVHDYIHVHVDIFFHAFESDEYEGLKARPPTIMSGNAVYSELHQPDQPAGQYLDMSRNLSQVRLQHYNFVIHLKLTTLNISLWLFYL